VLAAALAVAITAALAPMMPRALFVVAYAAVTVAAWYGGTRAGLLAGALCVLGVDYFVIPPTGTLRPTEATDYVPMAVFVAVAWLTGTLADARRRALDAAERATADLAAANAQLQEQALELEVSNQELQEQTVELEAQTAELHGAARRLEERTAEAQTAREAAEGAARRVAYLAEASARLAASLDVEATLRTLADLAVPALADWSFVEVLERGRVRPAAVAHSRPEMVRLAHELLGRYPIDLDAPFGTGKVLRTGAPELNPDIPDAALVAVAQDDAHLAALRQIGFRSSLSVPLVDPGDGRAVAVLSLVSAESGRRYDRPDLEMAEEVARRASVALASARLYAAQQAALRRAVGLQRVSGALAGTLTAGEVAAAVVRHGRDAVGAAAGSFFALTADAGTLELLASEGYAETSVRAFARIPVTPGRPLSDAVLGDAPAYLRSLEEADGRYPEMAPVLRATGYEAFAALPVRAGAGPEAAFSFSFAAPRAFDAEETAFLETLAAQAGQALERARLVEAERAARAAAEEANAAKTQFLSTMSHELRTPLNAIGGYAELLAMGLRGPVTEAQRVDLERLRRANQHMARLVTDVLNFARLDAGQVEYRVEAVELGPLVADLETLVGPQLAAKRLAFDHDGCAPDTPAAHTLRADAEKVRQILLNLLSNAVKFTDAGGRVALACATDPAGGVVRLRVTDTGRGIPADQRERVFQPFVQVDRHRTHESQQGVGLGLAISRDLARGMGGDLTLESEPGVGSTFTLTLPGA
jgi:signal transduction histidine kinase